MFRLATSKDNDPRRNPAYTTIPGHLAGYHTDDRQHAQHHSKPRRHFGTNGQSMSKQFMKLMASHATATQVLEITAEAVGLAERQVTTLTATGRHDSMARLS